MLPFFGPFRLSILPVVELTGFEMLQPSTWSVCLSATFRKEFTEMKPILLLLALHCIALWSCSILRSLLRLLPWAAAWTH
uniref:Uncharacterized protein n=1 Tax=Physcomitrium patens TaxID=3218 RepID=A0A2K1L1D2_PHYPA|nr:hypothetical protein PHYPA_002631 [Physcomitrium patens]